MLKRQPLFIYIAVSLLITFIILFAVQFRKYFINTSQSSKQRFNEVQLLIIANSIPDHKDGFDIGGTSRKENLLKINVGFGGGCKKHSFMLYSSPNIQSSINPEVNFVLIHNANGDGCEAFMKRDLIFDITPLTKIVDIQKIKLFLVSKKIHGSDLQIIEIN